MTTYLVYFALAGVAANAARVGVDLIYNAVHHVSKWAFKKESSELTTLEKDMVDKIKNGELRLYEVAIPSFIDQEGVFTRFIMIDNKRPHTYTDTEGPVWL